jgi:hypothetical protein
MTTEMTAEDTASQAASQPRDKDEELAEVELDEYLLAQANRCF